MGRIVQIDTITIGHQFNGPPTSGQGGYSAGMVARYIEGPSEVTLKKPPPLDRPLSMERGDSGLIRMMDGEEVIAEGKSCQVAREFPKSPTLEATHAAERNYLGLTNLPFPTCYGCGTERGEGAGLRIFSGPVDGTELVAGTWTPDQYMSGENTVVRPEFVWAALDCPGGWGTLLHYFKDGMPPGSFSLLGRMQAALLSPVLCGERYIVSGWPKGQEGRKFYSGMGIFTEQGEPLALGGQTWIFLNPNLAD